MISGATGARIQSLWSEGEASLQTTILGTAAGIISGYVYLVAQLVANPPNFFVFIFTSLFGFTAGFTLDKVFKKLAASDPLALPVLPKSKSTHHLEEDPGEEEE
jgi:xanthosine utilization system XapX-like protein